MKLGLIAYGNRGGLGAQTRRLFQMLHPYRVLVINSTRFSKNKELHTEWYKGSQVFTTRDGMPTDEEIDAFLKNLTHVFLCENPYNFYLPYRARQLGITVICQLNYEFAENVGKLYLPRPDIFAMPSYWMLDEVKRLFGEDHVVYLPPPIDHHEFDVVRDINIKRKGTPRFLHIIGTLAYKDRNGTLDLLKAVQASKSQFELVVRTQHQLSMEYFLDDPRVSYDLDNKETNAEMYEDFDALILPRRYGGLSLTTCEALMAGLPVIMTDISPNRELLPATWLVKSTHNSRVMIKAPFDVYYVDIPSLTEKIDWLVTQDFSSLKTEAYEIAIREFDRETLYPRYLDLFNKRKS